MNPVEPVLPPLYGSVIVALPGRHIHPLLFLLLSLNSVVAVSMLQNKDP